MNNTEISNAIGLPFEQAVVFFKNKINIPAEKWDDLWNEQHTKGFMIAGAMKADLLQDFRNAVDKAIDKGQGLEAFRKDFDAIVEAHGWDYNGSRNWRSRVIWETNIRTAYSAGRWQQMTDPEVLKTRPYLQYRHGDSRKPRPLHLAWDNLILKADDPWWNEHYPPSGYGCKCKVFSLNERAMKRAGKTKPDKAPDHGHYEVTNPQTGKVERLPNGVDPSFGYNAGKDYGTAGRILSNVLNRVDPTLQKALIANVGDKIKSTAKRKTKIVKDLVAAITPENILQLETVKDMKKALESLVYNGEVAGTTYQWGCGYRHPKAQVEFNPVLRANEVKQGISVNGVTSLVEAQAIVDTFAAMQAEAKRLGIVGVQRLHGTAKFRSNGNCGDGSIGILTNRKIKPKFTPPEGSNWKPQTASESFYEQPPVISTLWHEFGHHIHQQTGRSMRFPDRSTFETEWVQWRKRKHAEGHVFKYPTVYSAKNSQEYFAETYALIKTGREDMVDQVVLEWMKGKGIV